MQCINYKFGITFQAVETLFKMIVARGIVRPIPNGEVSKKIKKEKKKQFIVVCKQLEKCEGKKLFLQPKKVTQILFKNKFYPKHKHKTWEWPVSLVRKPWVPGKCGTLVCITEAVLLCKALFCFTWNLLFSIIDGNRLMMCVVSQPCNRKITKMVLGVSLFSKSYLEN